MVKKTTTITTTTVVETDDVKPVSKSDKARLIFILDRSGSMGSIMKEAIGGFNAFVEGQKAQPGKARLSLVIFDNIIETIHDGLNLKEVPVLTDAVYQPRGMTAMYDAIGVTITKYLAQSASDEKTILAILTDGAENASQEYSGKAVADLIKKAETEHNWEVLFLGANIDVSKVAADLNIQGHKFASFNATAKGLTDTYAAINTVTSLYRSVGASGQSLSASELNLQTAVDAASK